MPRLLPFRGANARPSAISGRASTLLSWLALTGLVVLATIGTSEAQVLRLPPSAEAAEPRIVPGEVIVRFKPGTSENSRDQALAAVDGVYAGTVPLPQGGEVVVARVPVGTENASADSLTIDTNVLAAKPNIVRAPG